MPWYQYLSTAQSDSGVGLAPGRTWLCNNCNRRPMSCVGPSNRCAFQPPQSKGWRDVCIVLSIPYPMLGSAYPGVVCFDQCVCHSIRPRKLQFVWSSSDTAKALKAGANSSDQLILYTRYAVFVPQDSVYGFFWAIDLSLRCENSCMSNWTPWFSGVHALKRPQVNKVFPIFFKQSR